MFGREVVKRFLGMKDAPRRLKIERVYQREFSATSKPPENAIHVTRWLALEGICSRREADRFLMLGKVRIDGEIVGPGAVVLPGQQASLDEVTLKRARRHQFTFLINKPVGMVSGQPKQPDHIPAVRILHSKHRCAKFLSKVKFISPNVYTKNLAPCGRLDIDSSGLLVLSSDGRIARKLIGDKTKIEKEYLVKVSGQIAPDGIPLLNHGLKLDERPLKPAIVEWVAEDTLRFILKEGRHRQIRRMCKLVGLKVEALTRIRIGKVKLDIPPGTWRPFRPEEETFEEDDEIEQVELVTTRKEKTRTLRDTLQEANIVEV